MINTVREQKIANIPIHGSHGHFVQLIPDDSLFFKFKTQAELNELSTNYVFKNMMNIAKNWPKHSVEFRTTNDIFSSFVETKLDEINPH